MSWKCPKCKLKMPTVSHPFRCTCGYMTNERGDEQKPFQKFADCRHLGEPTGEEVHCGCPSSPLQPVYRCELHETTCTRNPTTRGKHRSCLHCFELEEGWEPKPSE